MTDPYFIMIAVGAAILIALAYFIWKQVERKKSFNANARFVREVLQSALSQKSTFDLKLLGAGINVGVAATLGAVEASALAMRSERPVSKEWDKKPVEVYFRIKNDFEPVFYVFESKVLKLAPAGGGAEFAIAVPEHLRVEKKRHFERANPPLSDILMVAVWAVAPGRRLPRTTADLGSPSVRWKAGETEMPVRVENISGSGIALRFANSAGGDLPVDTRKGRQLICLVAYKTDPAEGKPAVFLCTAEIMNARSMDTATAVGLEFTNWAVQEQGENEIHWAHNSPWRGVKPILEWVKRLHMAHN